MEKKAGETLGKPESIHGILPALHKHILAYLNLHMKVKTQIYELLETVNEIERGKSNDPVQEESSQDPQIIHFKHVTDMQRTSSCRLSRNSRTRIN